MDTPDAGGVGSGQPGPNPAKTRTLLWGAFAGHLAAGVGILLSVALASRGGASPVAAAINIGLVPPLIGFVAAWCWRRLPMGLAELTFHTAWLSGIGLVGAAVLFSEGILCLAMAAPLYFLMLWVGVQLGHQLFRVRPGPLNVLALPLLLVAVVAESRWAGPPPRAVFTDEIRIQAPPDRVWPHVVSFAPIPDPPDFWMFRLGLPYPVETPPGADAVGRERLCVFSQNTVFRERVTAFEPARRLRFEIVESPKHPELIGHFEAHWGEFELRPEPDGSTTLIGRSAYTLHTRPLWYFDLWTRHLGSAVHLRVMRNARRLAEPH